MNTYGDFFKEKTPEELAKQCSIVNVMRERERCAKILEALHKKGIGDWVSGWNDALKMGAADIRAQSQEFTTIGEMYPDA